ncbi:MAG: hypothetical protein K6L80_09995 [Agarilytica sp.]
MLNKPSENTFDELIRLRTHKRPNVDDTHVDPDEVLAKVIEDINFLRGRIDHIKRSSLSARNPTILSTYESMLKSRESILTWLQEDSDDMYHSSSRAN